MKITKKIGFSTWLILLVGVGMLFLHLCRNQGRVNHLSEWDFFLQNRGKVVVFSENQHLYTTIAKSVELIPAGKIPQLLKAGTSNDMEKFVNELKSRGINTLVVETASGGISPYPAGSILHALSFSRPLEHFHILYICPLYEIVELLSPPPVKEEELTEAFSKAREVIFGSYSSPSHKPGSKYLKDLFEVAIELHGLPPIKLDKKRVKKVRRQIYASGLGEGLVTATVDAAKSLKKNYNKKLKKEIGELRSFEDKVLIEIHVMFDFALINHLKGQYTIDESEYQAFLNITFKPGIHGIYLNRGGMVKNSYISPPRSHFRLPSESIYWMRLSGKRMIERIIRDLHISTLTEFSKKRTITVDRFRTINFIESAPGKKPIRLHRASPLVTFNWREKDKLIEAGKRAASWMHSRLKDGGRFAESYFPDRDYEKFTARGEITFSTLRPAAGCGSFLNGWEITEDEKYLNDFKLCLKNIFRQLRFCPGSEFLKLREKKLPGYLIPPPGQEQKFNFCGPVNRKGIPQKIEKWGQKGIEEKQIPQELIFVYGNTAVSTEETAFIGLTLLRLYKILTSGMDDLKFSDAKQKNETIRSVKSILDGIYKFVIFMQRQDGSFQGYFVDRSNGFYRTENASGGAVALRFLSEIKTSKIKNPLKELAKAKKFYLKLLEQKFRKIKENNSTLTKAEKYELLKFIPLCIESLAYSSIETEDRKLAEKLLTLSIEIIERMQITDENDPSIDSQPDLDGGFVLSPEDMPDYRTVKFASCLSLMLKMARHFGFEREKILPLENSFKRATRFSLQLQFRYPQNTFFLPEPLRADGGIKQSPVISRQRIDFTASFLELIKNATEE